MISENVISDIMRGVVTFARVFMKFLREMSLKNSSKVFLNIAEH